MYNEGTCLSTLHRVCPVVCSLLFAIPCQFLEQRSGLCLLMWHPHHAVTNAFIASSYTFP